MISEFNRSPNMVACQYLPEQLSNKIDNLLGKLIRRNPILAEAHRQALQAANNEFNAYEDWLCQQSHEAAPLPYDNDIPW